MTDLLERDAFAAKHAINDIYSCSWGPEDDGKTVDGPHTLAKVCCACCRFYIYFLTRSYAWQQLYFMPMCVIEYVYVYGNIT